MDDDAGRLLKAVDQILWSVVIGLLIALALAAGAGLWLMEKT